MVGAAVVAPTRGAVGKRANGGTSAGVNPFTVVLALIATGCLHLLVTRANTASQDVFDSQLEVQRLTKESNDFKAALFEAQSSVSELTRDLEIAQAAVSARRTQQQLACPVPTCPDCVCNCPRAAADQSGNDASPAKPVPIFPSADIGVAPLGAKSPPAGCGPSRGLYEDKQRGLLVLPPDYCDVSGAGVSSKGVAAPATSRFERVDPATVTLAADGECHWAPLFAWRERPHTEMCTHDPAVDGHVSHAVHKGGSWLKAESELPAFASVACTPDRPFMFDIGSNIGEWRVWWNYCCVAHNRFILSPHTAFKSLPAPSPSACPLPPAGAFSVIAAAKGCHVVLLDPMAQNLGRALESIRRLGALANATFYRVSGPARPTKGLP